MALSNKLTKELEKLGLNANNIENLASQTLSEDLGGGVDVTSEATIPEDQDSIAEFVARKPGVIAGLHMAAAILETAGVKNYEILVPEGARIETGQMVLLASGKTRKLLLAERSALNFLGMLSGIATLTSSWVAAVSGTNTKIRDTRKTTPLHRELEKFAVRMGGGENHRLSLSDAALIKDNHVLAAGGVSKAFSAVKEKYPNIGIEVEVDSLDQLKELIDLDVELVLLDNMSKEECREAVAIVNGRFKLEASGGLTIENARAYAETGVDYLAVGALTHSAPVLDIGLDLRME